MTLCYECRRPVLYYEDRKEWGHSKIGGGAALWACKTCYWRGSPHPAPTQCPTCYGTQLIDLHHAAPEGGRP